MGFVKSGGGSATAPNEYAVSSKQTGRARHTCIIAGTAPKLYISVHI